MITGTIHVHYVGITECHIRVDPPHADAILVDRAFLMSLIADSVRLGHGVFVDDTPDTGPPALYSSDVIEGTIL